MPHHPSACLLVGLMLMGTIGCAGREVDGPAVMLHGKLWHVVSAGDTVVDLGFYDDADPGDLARMVAQHEAFAAEAGLHSRVAVPVRSEGDLRRYLADHADRFGSVGFFGHGNADGIYINRVPLSDWAVQRLIKHLQPDGSLFLFACGPDEPSSTIRYTSFLHRGQSLYVHLGVIRASFEAPPLHYTGFMHSDGDSDMLWMFCYTRGDRPVR